MIVPLSAPLANAVVTAPGVALPLDGASNALLSALAPLWPAIGPWLVVSAAVLVMGIATEVVVRELQRTSRAPSRAPLRASSRASSRAPSGVRPAGR